MIRETIKAEMAVRGEKPATLAKNIGIHTSPLYNYLNNKAGLSYDVLEKICHYYDLVLIKKYT